MGDVIQVALKHMTQTPPSLCARVPGLLPEIERVIFQALNKDPAARFSSVLEFVERLKEACEQHPPLPGRTQPVFSFDTLIQGQGHTPVIPAVPVPPQRARPSIQH